MADAVLPHGENLDTPLLEGLADLHAHGIESLVGVGNVAEDEGKVEHGRLGKEVAEDGGAGEGHVHRSEGETLDEVALVSELAAGKYLDFNRAARLVLHQLGEFHRALGVWVLGVGDVPQLEGVLRREGGRCRRYEQYCKKHDRKTFHPFSASSMK